MAKEPREIPSGAPPGTRIGARYRVEAVLGRGGMGAVYRVWDERKDCAVALKQLHRAARESASAALVASQFEHEYHTLCQLAHPSIIEVYDYGVDDSGAFYTMELLDGEDLRERGRLAWRDACAVLRDVASSLAIMHSRGLLHRDISARNVRCTAAGNAKLIDFGAMTVMGLCRHVVGTPPFVPPEALQLQALDGRSDLYALGALAYSVLTGGYPYPARTFGELRDQWRNVPANLRRYQADVPEALDQLVMELIELDRSARPKSAAEVMERLSGIAGLALRELPEVSRAYLVAPMLVGRDEPLAAVRAKLVQARKRGGGSSFLIEGTEGTGRSRLIEACTLEARLLGATVLRADAADAEAGDHGVAKALCARLVEERPELARQRARPWQRALRQLVPALASTRSDRPRTSAQPGPRSPSSLKPSFEPPPGFSGTDAPQDTRALQYAAREFLLAVARDEQLVIAVDDAERIDSASAALLGALAHGAPRRRLTLIVALRTGAAPNPALSLLRELAQPLVLGPLTCEQSEALLGSLFGETGRLAALGERVYALSGGNPRWTMALCEHLVETGRARYEAGSWRLPAELASEDLPSSLTAAAAARIAGLPPDARALAQALSLGDPALLTLDRYPLLTEHGDPSRVYRALDALVLSGVLTPEGDRHRFVQHGIADLLRTEITPRERCELHARLAVAYERVEDPMRVAYHMLLAGQDEAGLARVIHQGAARLLSSPILLDTYAAALEAATRSGLRHRQIEFQIALVSTAVGRADYESFNQHAWPLLSCLWRDSGFADFVELRAAMEPAAAMQAAQARSEARYESTPERDRGYPPRESAVRLGTLIWTVVTMAATAQELELVERLPSLEPFAFIPTMRLTRLQIEYYRHLLSGRSHLAERTSAELLDALDGSGGGGLPPELQNNIRCFQLHNQGLFAAARADRAALEWVASIEDEPYYRVYALRVRTAYELMRGNAEAAGSLRRRAELFALEDGLTSILPGTSTRLELIAYSATDDVIGVKRTLERLELVAARFPNWRPTCELARSQYQRIQGDLEGALHTVSAAMSMMRPARHIDWGLGAAMHVALLSAAGRGEQAVQLGRDYLTVCEREDLAPLRFRLLRVVSEALTRCGRPDEALPMLEEHLALARSLQVSGLPLGLAYEARARLAIAMKDKPSVQQYAQLCAQAYKGTRSSTLGPKYKALMREAESAGLALPLGALSGDDSYSGVWSSGINSSQGLTVSSLINRVLDCGDRSARAREGLRVLLESTGAAGGFLFAMEDGKLQLLASLDESEPPAELLLELASSISSATHDSDTMTSIEAAGHDDSMTSVEAAGHGAEPTSKSMGGDRGDYEALSMRSSPEHPGALIALLRYETEERDSVRRELLEALSDALA
jgi:hypothetical protein